MDIKQRIRQSQRTIQKLNETFWHEEIIQEVVNGIFTAMVKIMDNKKRINLKSDGANKYKKITRHKFI